MQGSHSKYEPPLVLDYGSLVRITAMVHPLAVATGDLSFSSPDQGPAGATIVPGGGGPAGGDPPDFVQVPVAGGGPGATDAGDTLDTGTSGGDPGDSGVGSGGGSGGAGGGSGAGGSGGGGSGGGGGDSLPFTGLAVGAVAAVGSALTAAGTALRRRLRARTGRDT